MLRHTDPFVLNISFLFDVICTTDILHSFFEMSLAMHTNNTHHFVFGDVGPLAGELEVRANLVVIQLRPSFVVHHLFFNR